MLPESRKDAILAVFARVPRLGQVKSRLAAELGEQAALDFHRAFLLDSLELVHRASAAGVQRAIWFSEPWDPDTEIEAHLKGFLRGTQEGADLGQRMQECITVLLAKGW